MGEGFSLFLACPLLLCVAFQKFPMISFCKGSRKGLSSPSDCWKNAKHPSLIGMTWFVGVARLLSMSDGATAFEGPAPSFISTGVAGEYHICFEPSQSFADKTPKLVVEVESGSKIDYSKVTILRCLRHAIAPPQTLDCSTVEKSDFTPAFHRAAVPPRVDSISNGSTRPTPHRPGSPPGSRARRLRGTGLKSRSAHRGHITDHEGRRRVPGSWRRCRRRTTCGRWTGPCRT